MTLLISHHTDNFDADICIDNHADAISLALYRRKIIALSFAYLINRSPECSLPPAATVAPLLHPCHCPVAALLVRAHLQRLLRDYLNSHWIRGLTS